MKTVGDAPSNMVSAGEAPAAPPAELDVAAITVILPVM